MGCCAPACHQLGPRCFCRELFRVQRLENQQLITPLLVTFKLLGLRPQPSAVGLSVHHACSVGISGCNASASRELHTAVCSRVLTVDTYSLWILIPAVLLMILTRVYSKKCRGFKAPVRATSRITWCTSNTTFRHPVPTTSPFASNGRPAYRRDWQCCLVLRRLCTLHVAGDAVISRRVAWGGRSTVV